METIHTKYYTEWELLSRTNRCLYVALFVALIFIGLMIAFVGLVNRIKVVMTIGAIMLVCGCFVSVRVRNMHNRETKTIKEKVFWMPNLANIDTPEFQEKWTIISHDDCNRYYVVPNYLTENGGTFEYGKND